MLTSVKHPLAADYVVDTALGINFYSLWGRVQGNRYLEETGGSLSNLGKVLGANGRRLDIKRQLKDAN